MAFSPSFVFCSVPFYLSDAPSCSPLIVSTIKCNTNIGFLESAHKRSGCRSARRSVAFGRALALFMLLLTVFLCTCFVGSCSINRHFWLWQLIPPCPFFHRVPHCFLSCLLLFELVVSLYEPKEWKQRLCCKHSSFWLFHFLVQTFEPKCDRINWSSTAHSRCPNWPAQGHS